MAQYNRVDSTSLEIQRLDAEYYGKVYVNNAEKIDQLSKCLTLEAMRDKNTPIRRGIDMPNFVEKANSPLMVTIASFDEPGINFDQLKRISSEQHDAFKGSHIKPGDLLIAMGGYAGKAAICPEDTPICNIGRHTARVKIDPLVAETRFIWAFIACKIGKLQFERYITGSVQAGINLEDIRSIKIPVTEVLAQKYIGDKVRQAEQLRAWAKELRDSVDSQLDNLKLPINEPPQMINLMSAKDMEDRLDPRPYRSHYLKLTESIESIDHESISKITTLASGCPVSSKDFVENEGIPLVRIRNIGFDDFIGLDTGIGEDVYQDSTKYHAKEKMIVVGMDGIFRSQFFIADELPMLVNQRVAMLSPTNIRGELLTHWLNRPEGQMQLNQWAVKTTVEHTSLSDIGRILIPRLDKELEDRLADNLLSARLAYRYSKFLTQVAKTLVEALIEGQLTEEQLIQAQQALEDGDNTLDKAILNKLSNEGYAVEGAVPLFSDVDELYSLLASANAAADSED
ncbi:restriction endonuclease subunit S [Psychrobacter sp. W2-37-MNA-CIBAN-0211]|uniref:restriction endonuclease subunit S n=1 Tax=Psychrobacter sp. W2-37-MNA-CIBAN-0211 TaxID=3140443 RepID=UPI003330AFF3